MCFSTPFDAGFCEMFTANVERFYGCRASFSESRCDLYIEGEWEHVRATVDDFWAAVAVGGLEPVTRAEA